MPAGGLLTSSERLMGPALSVVVAEGAMVSGILNLLACAVWVHWH